LVQRKSLPNSRNMCCCCRLKSCLCCFNLRRGVQVLGVLSVIVVVIALIVGIVQLEQAKNQTIALNGNDIWSQYVAPYYVPVIATFATLLGIDILVNVLLVCATVWHSRCLLLPWLIWKMLVIVASVVLIGCAIAFFSYEQMWPSLADPAVIGYTIGYGVGVGLKLLLHVYFYVVVVSLFHEFAEERRVAESAPPIVVKAASGEHNEAFDDADEKIEA
jgi:hypothetical protein